MTNDTSRYHKEREVVGEAKKRANVAHKERVSQMTSTKHEKRNVAVKVVANTNTIQKFLLSKRQWMPTRQALWYISTEMKISKRQFENAYFKDMLYGMYEKLSDGAILTKDQLVKYVHGDINAFLHFFKLMLNKKVS